MYYRVITATDVLTFACGTRNYMDCAGLIFDKLQPKLL
jgi:hypothetical protein